MKKRVSIILVILLLLASVLGTFCYASEIQPRTTAEDGINPVSETHPEDAEKVPNTEPNYDITYNDLYVFEDNDYEMSKAVDGNIFMFVNGDVKFTGAVNGSAFIFANGTVEFTEDANIYDALFVFAKEVKINGKIYDTYACTEKFELMPNGYISRDIRVAAQDVKLRGTIYRDVYLTAENIDVKDGETALLLGGDFNYTSGKEVENLKEVVSYGEIRFKLEKETTEENVSFADTLKEYLSSAVTSIVYVLVVYFLLILIGPKFVEKVGKDLKEKTIMPFVVGLVSWVVVVLAIVISFVLLFTSFGSPIALIAWFLMIAIIYISSAVFSISVLSFVKEKVEKINGNKGLEICALAVIALCVWILQKLPFIGGVCSFVILTTGIGLIVRNIIARKEINNDVTKATEESAE